MSSWAAELATGRRRLAVALGAGAIALAALVPLGRWEGSRYGRDEARGMERTLVLIGPLDSPTLSGYRVLPDFDCLVYRRGANPYALEACIDREGRVVETIDRRRLDRRIDSLAADPSASTVRVDRALVERLLRRLGAPATAPQR